MAIALAKNSSCYTICSPMHDLAAGCLYSNKTTGLIITAPAMHDCICKNQSFNVTEIAPLCADCLDENGRPEGAGPMGSGMGGMMGSSDDAGMGMMGDGGMGMAWGGESRNTISSSADKESFHNC